MSKVFLVKMAKFPVKYVRWAFDFNSWQPTESQILKAFSCVQPEEKERIGRFVFKRDAKASLIGRLLIRKFIAENSDLGYNEILLKRNELGKPFVENSQVKGKLKFSVSHHGRLVVFVGHLSKSEIGIDVMTVKYQGGKELPYFFHLMSRHFGTNEWNVIKNTSSSDDVKMMLFNRNWALKESYLKAVGTGISVDLGKIEFKINTKSVKTDGYIEDAELFVDKVKQTNWLFQETLLASDHLVVVAVETAESIDTKPFVFLSFDQITQNAIPLIKEDIEFTRDFMQKEEEPC